MPRRVRFGRRSRLRPWLPVLVLCAAALFGTTAAALAASAAPPCIDESTIVTLCGDATLDQLWITNATPANDEPPDLVRHKQEVEQAATRLWATGLQAAADHNWEAAATNFGALMATYVRTPSVVCAEAEALFQSHSYFRAIARFDELRESSAALLLVAHIRTGQALMAIGRPTDSYLSFQNAVDLHSTCTPALLGKAVALEHAAANTQSRELALQAYLATIASDPALADAHAGAARLHTALAQPTQAVQAWQHAVTLAPNSTAYRVSLAFAQARHADSAALLQTMQRLPADVLDNNSTLILLFADALAATNQSDQALTWYRKLLPISTIAHIAAIKMATIFAHAQKHDDAIALLTPVAAAGASQCDSACLILFAAQLQVAGKHTQAVEVLRAAADRPDCIDAAMRSCTTFPQAARLALEQVLEVNPMSAPGHEALGLILIQAGQTNTAAMHLSMALNLDTDRFSAHEPLARIYQARGAWALCATHWAAVTRGSPAHCDAWLQLGTCQLHASSFMQAASTLAQAVECNTTDQYSMLLTAQALLLAQQPRRAVDFVQALANMRPTRLLHCSIADLLLLSHQPAPARDYLLACLGLTSPLTKMTELPIPVWSPVAQANALLNLAIVSMQMQPPHSADAEWALATASSLNSDASIAATIRALRSRASSVLRLDGPWTCTPSDSTLLQCTAQQADVSLTTFVRSLVQLHRLPDALPAVWTAISSGADPPVSRTFLVSSLADDCQALWNASSTWTCPLAFQCLHRAFVHLHTPKTALDGLAVKLLNLGQAHMSSRNYTGAVPCFEAVPFAIRASNTTTASPSSKAASASDTSGPSTVFVVTSAADADHVTDSDADAASVLLAAAHLALGQAWMRLQMYTNAQAAAAQAAAHAIPGSTTHLAALLLAAESADANDEKHSVLHWLNKAVAAHPRSAVAQARLGAVLAAAGKWPDAIQHFEQTLAVEPDAVDVRHVVACELSRHQSKLPLALGHYAEALKWSFAPSISLDLIDLDAADASLLLRATGCDRTLQLDAQLDGCAVWITAAGRLGRMQDCLNATVPISVDIADMHLGYLHADHGLALERAGRPKDAINSYRLAVSSVDSRSVLPCGLPGSLIPALRSARLLLRQRHLYRALHLLQHIVDRGCEMPPAWLGTIHNWIGDILWLTVAETTSATQALDRQDAAVAQWQRAAGILHTDGMLQLKLAMGFRAMGHADTAQVHARAGALTLQDTIAAGALTAGLAARYSFILHGTKLIGGWETTVLESARPSVLANDRDIAWMNKFILDVASEAEMLSVARGIALQAQSVTGIGQEGGAQNLIRAALGRAPPASRGLVMHMLGELMEAGGNLAAAADWFSQALRATPPCPESQLALGRVLVLQGRYSGAIKVYHEVLIASPPPSPVTTIRSLSSLVTLDGPDVPTVITGRSIGSVSVTSSRGSTVPKPPGSAPPPGPPPGTPPPGGSGTSSSSSSSTSNGAGMWPAPSAVARRARAHSCLAALQIIAGQRAEGLAQFRAAHREIPGDPALHLDLAHVLASNLRTFWLSDVPQNDDCANPWVDDGDEVSLTGAPLWLRDAQSIADATNSVMHFKQAIALLRIRNGTHLRGRPEESYMLPALCRVGWLLLALGEVTTAQDAFHAALDLGTASSVIDTIVEAQAGLGRVHATRGLIQDASAFYASAQRLAAGSATISWATLSMLGWQLHEEGLHHAAREVLARAVQLCQSTQLQRVRSASSRYRAHASCFKPTMALAAALYDSGSLVDAADMYERLAVSHISGRTGAAVANNLGVCLIRQGRWTRGGALLRKSLQIMYSPLAAANYAIGLRQAGHPSESLEQLDTAICHLAEAACGADSGCSCRSWGHYSLLAATLFAQQGESQRAVGNHTAGLQALGQSVQIVESSLIVLGVPLNESLGLPAATTTNYSHALAACRASDAQPCDLVTVKASASMFQIRSQLQKLVLLQANALGSVAAMQASSGLTEQAVVSYSHAILLHQKGVGANLDSQDAVTAGTWTFELAQLLHQLGRFAEAATCFQTASWLWPSAAAYSICNQGVACVALGERESAKTLFATALKLNGSLPNATAGLAYLSAATGANDTSAPTLEGRTIATEAPNDKFFLAAAYEWLE